MAVRRPERWRLRPFRDRAILVEQDDPGERLCSVEHPAEPREQTARRTLIWQVELLDLINGSARGSRPAQDHDTS